MKRSLIDLDKLGIKFEPGKPSSYLGLGLGKHGNILSTHLMIAVAIRESINMPPQAVQSSSPYTTMYVMHTIF